MEDWAKLKVVDLKAELKRRDLHVNGLKAELVERLRADDVTREGEGEAEEQRDGKSEISDPPAAGEQPAVASAADNEHEEAAPGGESLGRTVDNAIFEAKTSDTETSQETKEVAMSTTINEKTAEEMQTDEPPTMVEPDSKSQASEPVAAAEMPDDKLAEAATPANLPSPESQKRKRRSQSPPPVAEDVARKRARAESDAGPKNGIVVGAETVLMSDAPELKTSGEDTVNTARAVAEPSRTMTPDKRDDAMDFERDVVPALHPATSALYINNLMRPLRPADLRSHLASLVSPSTSPDDIITTFFLDQIRTHAFVIFDSTASASRVRTALHDRVWPEESNRKALSVDFVPPEKVAGWIETEEGIGRGGRSGSRWEIVYDKLPDGSVDAHLESGAVSASRSGPPPPTRGVPGPNPRDSTNSIPLGPRGFRGDANPLPTGPRSSRDPFPRERHDPSPGSLTTRSRPVISYQPVSAALAKRRIENMQSYYTTDTRRYLGHEINRYYFEDRDKFVDRGKEVFEGIRPPHRERGGGPGGRRGGGGGGRRRGGGGGNRGRGGDRYMPPARGGLRDDDGRLPRYDDN